GARQATEEATLEETLARLEAEIEGCRGAVRDAQLSLTQAEAEACQGRVALGGREDALRLKARAVELLPDAQSNMAKLQVLVETSSRRIVSLAGQWERHRGP
ncbi:CCD22 protein, partial [Podargus strigoides]|nr:CCD22 protein [Podargus strigoides]